MNQLITTSENAITINRAQGSNGYCGRCGNPVVAHDNFCRNCGNACQNLVAAEVITHENGMRPTYAEASPPSPIAQTIKQVLSNRWLVLGIVAVLGPLGLPALWFSPRFRPATKIIITTIYVVLTAVVPVVVSYYVLENSFHPLAEAFGS